MPANFSDWKDASENNLIVLKRGETVLSWADVASESGDRNLCFRLEVHCVDTESVLLYLTRIPMAHDQLVQLAEGWEVDPNSDKIPVSTCLVGNARADKGLVAKLMVQEPDNHKVGMGIYPLLEQVDILLYDCS